MPTITRLLLATAFLAGACTVALPPVRAQQPDAASAATLTDAQRRLRQASDQLDRAQRDADRARRTQRRAEEDLDEAQRNVERRRNQVEEAKKGVVRADEGVAEAQRQHDAARSVIEKLYDAQQR